MLESRRPAHTLLEMSHERPKRILVVDDDTSITEVLQLALPEYEVAIAGDAENALAMAPDFQPDLCIVDLILPGMRGTTLAVLLREQPQFAELPIFLLSSLIEATPGSPEPVRVKGLPAFTKPFELSVLTKHVQLHLEGGPAAEDALQRLEPGRITGEE
jgi:DNA-binding response OmpR family regulator